MFCTADKKTGGNQKQICGRHFHWRTANRGSIASHSDASWRILLRKNRKGGEARAFELRAESLGGSGTEGLVVDVSELEMGGSLIYEEYDERAFLLRLVNLSISMNKELRLLAGLCLVSFSC